MMYRSWFQGRTAFIYSITQCGEDSFLSISLWLFCEIRPKYTACKEVWGTDQGWNGQTIQLIYRKTN
jgi:hypothetical protein